jgi:sporulation protein YlmC with PRC-barrel domain
METPGVWLASDLIGMKVVSQQSEHLGKIEDVVVHPGGRASYAVLSIGGWLGMGEKLFAMPMTVLRTVEADTTKPDSKRSLILPLQKDQLEKAPGFDKSSWPNFANPDWTKDVDAFYVGKANPNTKTTLDPTLRSSVATWRVSDLKGAGVRTPTGETLGDLKDLAIDTNGRVRYVAISVGGFLGMGDTLVAVPWDSLVFSHEIGDVNKQRIALAVTKDQLKNAPRFMPGLAHCAEMCDPRWIQGIYTYFSGPGLR